MEIGVFLERAMALLWRASWQASVLVLIVILFQLLLGRRLAPLWRHALWLLVVARLLLPVTPSSPWSLFNYWNLEPSKFADMQTSPLSTQVPPHSGFLISAKTAAEKSPEMPLAETTLAQATQGPPQQTSSEPSRPTFQSAFLSLQPYLGWIWFIGALVLGIRLAWGNYLFGLQLRRRQPIVNDAILALMDECRQVMGVRRPLTLLETPELESPALFGCFAIKLLLPERIIQTFSTEELRHVFLHELAHIRRRDTSTNWLTTILLTLHWFNPIIWFAFRRMRVDRELACDAMVLAHTSDGEGKPYGQTVIKVLEGFSKNTAIPGLVGILEEKREIKRIIRMITQFKKTSPWSVQAVVLVIALGLISLTDAQTKKGGEALAESSGLEKASQTGSTVTSSAAGPASESQANAKVAGSQAVSGLSPGEGDASPEKNTALAQTTLRLLQDKWDRRVRGTRLSPDGLKTVYSTRDSLTIVRDLSTGVDRKYEQAARYTPVWSPDSKRIAFLDKKSATKWQDRTISILTLDSEDVEKTGIQGIPCDWSGDGRFLLVGVVYTKDDEESIFPPAGVQLVDLKTRETQTVIHRIKSPGVNVPRFSPDGRYVAFYDSVDKENNDVFVQPIGSDERIRVTSHKGNDIDPLWSADGKHILFMSNRVLGRQDLMTVAFHNGKPLGDPKVIVSDMGDNVKLLSYSKSGRLLFHKSRFRSEVFSTNINPVSGSVLGEPNQLTDSARLDNNPNWSRNGQHIAYYQQTPDYKNLLCVMNSDGRDKRTLVSVTAFAGTKAWHPDNEHVLYPGFEADPENPEKRLRGVYSVSIRSRERKLVYHDPNFWGHMDLSPDGKHLALLSSSSQKTQLYIVDYNGQNRRQLVKSDDEFLSPIFTPDGKEIIYTLSVSGEGKKYRQSIMAVSIKGGEPREIYASEDPKVKYGTFCSSWLRDGRYVFDMRGQNRRGQYRRGQYRRGQYAVSMDGKSDPVRISDRMGASYCVSPDATKAVFNVSDSNVKLWLMSDFLPNDELAKN